MTYSYDATVRFPGQYFDAETGLHQNWHRDYDPSIGRYLQSDPVGLDAGINTYVYALNAPALYTDDDGLCPSELDTGWWANPTRQETDWVNGTKCSAKKGNATLIQDAYNFFGKLTGSEGSCDCDSKNKICIYSVVLRHWSRQQPCATGPWSPWKGTESKPHEVRATFNCETGELKVQGPPRPARLR